MTHPRFPLPRRNVLRLGALGLSSLGILPRAVAAPRQARAKQVLVIFEQGGVSQMDTFDQIGRAHV